MGGPLGLISLCSVHDLFAAQIIVNVNHPERNREVLVFPLRDIKGVDQDTTRYYGYYIMHQIVIRHIADDPTVKF
jgi:hypothetical protein